MSEDKVYQIALTLIPGVGHQLARQLISYCNTAKEVFEKPKGKLLKVPGIGPQIADSIKKSDPLLEAEMILQKAEKKGVRIITIHDKEYPFSLKQINDAPLALYVKGNIDFNNRHIISIVGTRNATNYGREFLESFVPHLQSFSPIIVSGLAYGIDIIAHQLAVEHDIPTVGVLACGVDKIYPASHQKVANKMIDNGAIISEYTFGTKPDAPRFPARNRIIAGLAEATVVVEAAAKGGALITAHLANDYSREVFALPGNIKNKYSEGCNNLIKSHHAHIISSPEDVTEALNWESTVEAQVAKPFDINSLPLEENEKPIAYILQDGALLLDEISWKTSTPVHQLASVLLNLELKGIIKPLPGKKYQLIK